MSTQIDKIIEIATQEWDFFQNQEIDLKGNLIKKGKIETDNGFWERVGEYWQFGVHLNLTGLNTDQPWSAAFISYVMRKSGLGSLFLYSEAHREYINRAINAKLSNDNSFGFWGHKTSDYVPKIGDLVCYARQNNVSYDNRPYGYLAHSDIVVDLKGNELYVIGGNVKDSVSLKRLQLNDHGYLIDNQFKWFAILENKITYEIAELNYDKSWLKKALEITGDFETSGNPFAGVTGNFDGMGISCGVLQWNIGKESLQPLVIKAGKNIVLNYMPIYGEEFWTACTANKSNGLKIVNSWQKSNQINKIATNELVRLFGSSELINIQIDFADGTGVKSFELASKWAKELNNLNPTLKEFCWFFDMLVLNGGLKGLWGNDVVDFLNDNGFDNSIKIVFNWITNYPSTVEEDGEIIKTYGKSDALKNTDVWKTGINAGNINLFILGYLRAKKSRPQFQLIVLNRRCTIATGRGYVNSEFENINF